jgi:uncharacterized protein (TIGR03437 family)
LQQLLEEQQNPSSPNYHKWLTPEQYADRFGVTQTDIDKITAWLTSQGFTVNSVARGRTWMTFSGTAAQIRSAFQTQLHRYNVNGKSHYANATAPSLPAALQDVVASIRGLNDFRPHPHAVKATADYTTGRGTHFMVPDDFATVYDVKPLYNAGIDGTGQKIVVVGQTQIKESDIDAFRQNFHLPSQTPQTILAKGSTDPGVSKDDLPEADLDIEWSGAIAPNATIVYVYADNAFDAAQYAIDQNLGPVMSMSYGLCEAADQVDLPVFQALAQQANAQGMTWLSASGDAGAADCEAINATVAQSGLSADIPGVTPEVTSVGGSQFNESGGSYWNASNNDNNGSAISYIPELAWNSSDLTNGLSATGGGVSTYFAKPAWQNGPGVPNDGFRDVPDVAFAASPAHDAFYVYTSGAVQYYGGTSVAAPSFAGIVALLNHYLVSTGIQSQPGVGNINPSLYRMAQNTSGVFHDITGGDNRVPCAAGSPNCGSSGTFGYSAGPGYDQATGLGSVDAANLIHQWSSTPPVNSAVVAAVDQNPVYQKNSRSGNPWTFTVTLTEEAGVATTLTNFTADGQDYTPQISALFGTSKIPANGSISATLGFKTLNVPRTIVFTFSGVDGSGAAWSTQISAQFQGTQVTNNIAGLSNAASGQQTYAPGMILSVYGAQLAGAPAVATAIPLPNFLSGVSAYVNNVPAPLYYVSASQLNIQIPYETQPGNATLEIDTPYQTTKYQFNVASTAPGIFMFGDGFINPSRSGSRRGTYTLFITGEGQVTPSLATGQTPSPRTPIPALPKPVQPYSVSIGGVDAPIQFIGIPSGLVGVTQINFTVPADAPLGNEPVIVTVGGVQSQTAMFTVTN